MKRISVILFMVLATYSYTFAQQPAICGDWVGTFSGEGENGFYSGKQYIRVICDNDRYFIRMKITYEGENYVDHFECDVYFANESTIKFTIDKGEGYYTDHVITLDGPTLKYTSSICPPNNKCVQGHKLTLYKEDNW